MSLTHYGKASAWSERQLAKVPALRRNPKLLRFAVIAFVAFLVVNEIRAIMYAPEIITRLADFWAGALVKLQDPIILTTFVVSYPIMAAPFVWLAVRLYRKSKNAPGN